MKFRAYIESGSKELEVDFEIEDEASAHARLTEAIGKIQKLAKKPERPAAKPSEAPRTVGAPASAPAGAK